MLQLVNQFDLKPGVSRDRFDAAWSAFADHVVSEGWAMSVGPVFSRRPDSGYDTDADRSHSLMAVIAFADQAQADAAWHAIESRAEPLGGLHRSVLALVRDPVFTFWSADQVSVRRMSRAADSPL